MRKVLLLFFITLCAQVDSHAISLDSVIFSRKGNRALVFYDYKYDTSSICAEEWEVFHLGRNEVELSLTIRGDSVFFFKKNIRYTDSYNDLCRLTPHPDLRIMRLSQFLEMYEFNQKAIKSPKDFDIVVSRKRGSIIKLVKDCGQVDSYKEWYTIVVNLKGKEIYKNIDSSNLEFTSGYYLEANAIYKRGRPLEVVKEGKFTLWESRDGEVQLEILRYGVESTSLDCNDDWILGLVVVSASRIDYNLARIR